MLTRKWAKRIVIVSLVAFSYLYILYKLIQFKQWNNLSIDWINFIPFLCIEFTLLILNLLLESKKWQTLLILITQVNLKSSIKMVLAGFTSGIITPLKAGEPLGRISFLPKQYFVKAAILNYFGGVIQTLIISIFGFIALYFTPIPLNFDITHHVYIIIFTLVTIVVLSIVIWLNKDAIRGKLKYLYKTKVFKSKIIIPILIQTCIISTIRYVIFCCQLFISIYFFCHPENYLLLTKLIFIYYFMITILPSNILIDFGIRGSVAIFLFSKVCHEPTYIIVSVFFIWIINQVIPALIGSKILLKNHLTKQSHNKKTL